MSSQKIAVVTDSSAYIPPSALEGLNVSVIPLWLIWDGDRFRDGIDIDPPTFYERLRQSKTLPTSSQPSPGEFVDFFRQVAEQADIIVGVLVSAKISGTIASARTAQGQLPGLTIRIVDARSSSMGLGLVVLAAARMAAAGGSLKDVVRARHGNAFLFAVIAGQYDLVAVDGDVAAGPDANAGRDRVVGIVVLDDNVGRIVHKDPAVVVVWAGVYEAQARDPDIVLAVDLEQPCLPIRQANAAAIDRHRLARVCGIGDIVPVAPRVLWDDLLCVRPGSDVHCVARSHRIGRVLDRLPGQC